MRKKIKYVLFIVAGILLLGSSYVAGCSSANRTVAELAERGEELQSSIDKYSVSVESLKSERDSLERKITDHEAKIGRMGITISDLRIRLSDVVELFSGFDSELGNLSEELSQSRQGIQEVTEGLSGIDSELQFYIEGAEDP